MVDAIQPGSVPFRKPEEERPNPAVKPLRLPRDAPEHPSREVPSPVQPAQEPSKPLRKPEKAPA
ncbi:hypothetical protein FJY93_00400 [Candidatus Kaiserbacteria bacterium]|nr:hypothetical protein [Candidatus Kaiserbacteria bacterium]